MPNHIQRRVSLVFSDQHHKLQLIEGSASVLFDLGHDKPRAMADLVLVEEETRNRINNGQWPGITNSGLDLVGVLVAFDDKLNKGRIVWLEDDVEDRERRLMRERIVDRNS